MKMGFWNSYNDNSRRHFKDQNLWERWFEEIGLYRYTCVCIGVIRVVFDLIWRCEGMNVYIRKCKTRVLLKKILHAQNWVIKLSQNDMCVVLSFNWNGIPYSHK